MKKIIKKARRNIKKGKVSMKGILLLFIVVSVIGLFSTSVFANGDNPSKDYIVESNDTLWSIAKKVCKNSNKENLNVQKVVFEIKDLNAMTTSDIFVGEEIKIPIY